MNAWLLISIICNFTLDPKTPTCYTQIEKTGFENKWKCEKAIISKKHQCVNANIYIMKGLND